MPRKAPVTSIPDHVAAHIAAAESRADSLEALDHLAQIRLDTEPIGADVRSALGRAIKRVLDHNEQIGVGQVAERLNLSRARIYQFLDEANSGATA